MTLRSDIASWDTRSAAAITRVYAKHMDRPSFLSDLVELIADPETAVGATWLLKHHFDESGKPLHDALVDRIYAQLPLLEHWAAKLHILQCMEKLQIPAEHRRKTIAFVDACLESDTKLVRAWGFTGLFVLAERFPSCRADAEKRIRDAAENDPIASVRARCRQLIKKIR